MYIVLRRLGGQLQEGLFLPLTPYPCGYFLQTPPDPTSFHNQVVPRVMPLDLCGPLVAQMVKSVTRQVVQGGCMVMTGTGCSRSVISLWM